MTPLNPRPRYALAEIIFQISVILLATLTCGAILVIAGNFISAKFFGFSMMSGEVDYMSLTSNQLLGFKITQSFYSIGAFILPPVIFAQIIRKNTLEYYGLLKASKWHKYLFAILLWAVFYPFVIWVYELNDQLDFSLFGAMGEQAEAAAKTADDLTTRMLEANNLGQLFINLFVVALLPAIGEELFFRGMVQKVLMSWTGLAHLAIWSSAIIFSAIHGQFDGFLPRMLLGAFFGYLFFWSGNLKLTILAHFVNNGSAVVMNYLYQHEMSSFNPDENPGMLLGLMSLVFSIPLLYVFYRNTRKQDLKVISDKANVMWTIVYTTPNVHHAAIVHDKLLDEGYNAVIVNKSDTAYGGVFGTVEVHVPQNEVESALARIKEMNL
ncbi:MAG: CPBP family intramembrane metalloprotease [Bacteroidetes bacterium]|nr:CPBP family intramembrane metalloprotease [Bacteroidota bacterium]